MFETSRHLSPTSKVGKKAALLEVRYLHYLSTALSVSMCLWAWVTANLSAQLNWSQLAALSAGSESEWGGQKEDHCTGDLHCPGSASGPLCVLLGTHLFLFVCLLILVFLFVKWDIQMFWNAWSQTYVPNTHIPAMVGVTYWCWVSLRVPLNSQFS